ncbi:hypothetical protein CEXT_150991 [Caerostris extrusa]|uniref:Uncharacterized protein n=1 Tax=Caerostris extrusa TaxID=172846 RepID=A0AAV4SQM0_CAEEX|nr:hypothetical protein CEXT_150991 [Caerostris extrusa]
MLRRHYYSFHNPKKTAPSMGTALDIYHVKTYRYTKPSKPHSRSSIFQKTHSQRYTRLCRNRMRRKADSILALCPAKLAKGGALEVTSAIVRDVLSRSHISSTVFFAVMAIGQLVPRPRLPSK